MAYSEAQKRASRKYNENNYDRLYITIAKGKKEEIKERAEKENMSLNEYVVTLIEKDLDKYRKNTGSGMKNESGSGGYETNGREAKRAVMEKYANIQRIKKYGREEIVYQERLLKIELELLGISAEELELG